MSLFRNVTCLSIKFAKPCQRKSLIGSFSQLRAICTSSILRQEQSEDQSGNVTFDPRLNPLPENPTVNLPSGVNYFNRAMMQKEREKEEEFSIEKLEELLMEMENKVKLDWDNDMPATDIPNPYAKPQRKCILCKYNVPLNYKNARLLSQFLSPHTGKIYGREVTGLCVPMQRHISVLIKRARQFGFLPTIYKELSYIDDPNIKEKRTYFQTEKEDSEKK